MNKQLSEMKSFFIENFMSPLTFKDWSQRGVWDWIVEDKGAKYSKGALSRWKSYSGFPGRNIVQLKIKSLLRLIGIGFC